MDFMAGCSQKSGQADIWSDLLLKRVFAALWLKEGLIDRVSSSLALSVVEGSAKDLCCFLSCSGNELENVRLFTYQLKCGIS